MLNFFIDGLHNTSKWASLHEHVDDQTKSNQIKSMEEYYEYIFNLANVLLHPTNDHLLIAIFKVGLCPILCGHCKNEVGYLNSTLRSINNLKEKLTNVNGNKVILDIYPMMKIKRKQKVGDKWYYVLKEVLFTL